MEIRDLDPVYFRVCRDGLWLSLCFTDLTEDEQDSVTKDWQEENWKGLAYILADTIRKIGDELGLYWE